MANGTACLVFYTFLVVFVFGALWWRSVSECRRHPSWLGALRDQASPTSWSWLQCPQCKTDTPELAYGVYSQWTQIPHSKEKCLYQLRDTVDRSSYRESWWRGCGLGVCLGGVGVDEVCARVTWVWTRCVLGWRGCGVVGRVPGLLYQAAVLSWFNC